MATLIRNPQDLAKRFDAVASLFDRIDPPEKIPFDVLSMLRQYLDEWNEAYMGSDWGYAATQVDTSRTWSTSDEQRYNALLLECEKLVKQAAAAPGVHVLLETREAPPKEQKETKIPDISVTAEVPWFWIIGSAAALGLVTIILAKKDKPKPVLAEPGYYRRRRRW